MNNINLVGRLTADPEVRYTPSQMAVANFTVAVNRQKSRDENAPTADFIGITAFGKTAEVIERFFTKGKWIGLQGRIQNNNYTDKDGVKHYTYQIIADRVEFVGNKSDDSGHQSNAPQQSIPDGFMAVEDDDIGDIPF